MAMRSDPSLWYAMSGCVAAYQPVACPGGALLARANVAHGGTGRYRAVTSAAPAYNPVAGWTFGATGQYLDTRYTPTAASTLIVAFREIGTTSSDPVLAGALDGVTGRFFMVLHRLTGTSGVAYGNGNYVIVMPGAASGVLAIAGRQGYRNGVAEGALTTGTYNNPWTIFIGALNINGGVYSPGPLNCEISAVLIAGRTLTPGEVWLASRQMAYCHVNPDWSAWGRRRRYYYAPAEAAAAAIYARRHQALRAGSRGAVQ